MAIAGSSRRNSHFMTASLTASIVGILLAFEFIAEVLLLSPSIVGFMTIQVTVQYLCITEPLCGGYKRLVKSVFLDVQWC